MLNRSPFAIEDNADRCSKQIPVLTQDTALRRGIGNLGDLAFSTRNWRPRIFSMLQRAAEIYFMGSGGEVDFA